MLSVLITGASTGIGLATAKALHEDGLNVLACARKADDLQMLRNLGMRAVELDVTNSEHIASLQQTLRSLEHPLDVLINNAGVAYYGPLECVSLDLFRQQFEINVFGLIAVTQACLPQLRASEGRIINVSSIAGKTASPFMAPYSGSKFAVEAISDALRRELVDAKVQVISVNPGPIATDIWTKRLPGMETPDDVLKTPELESAYGRLLRAFVAKIAEAKRGAVSVDTVVDVMRRAIQAEHPRTRYYVGPGIGVSAFLSSILPDRVLDGVVAKQLKG